MKPLAAAGLAAAFLIGAPAFAQQPAPAGPANEPRVNQLIVYGQDPCPPSTDDEIIVCARKPEGDRYRIPENLRDDPNAAVNQSWANRASELQYVGRSGTDSCSPVGPGGQTGCFARLVNQARSERASRDTVNWNRLVEEARQERLSHIDAAAAAEEAAQQEREAAQTPPPK
jgi:hypothetical protein